MQLVDQYYLQGERSVSLAELISAAYETVVGRPASEQEIERAGEFLARYEQVASKLDKQTLTAGTAENRTDAAYVEMVRRDEQLVAYHRLRGIELNGVDQRLEFTANEALNSAAEAFTVECWVQPEDVRQYMMIVGRDGQSQRYWKLGVYGQEIAGRRQNVVFSQFFADSLGGHRLTVDEPFVIPLGEWTHLALTYGDGYRRMYVNGRLVDEVEATGQVPVGEVPLTVGSRHDDTEWFRGTVDHVAIYNSPLDHATIRQHYGAFRKATREPFDTTRLSALRAFCQSLFCLNEFLYVE